MNSTKYIISNTCPICRGNNISLISPYKNFSGKFLNADTIRRCQSCGMVFAAPIPTEVDLDHYYMSGQYYHNVGSGGELSDSFFIEMAKSRLRFINQFFLLEKFGRCLDVGAGRGLFRVALSEVAPNFEYYAVEPDSSCREFYTDKVAGYYEHISQVERRFDLVVANQVLEHVLRPVDFLKQLIPLLTPRGVLFIEVPCRDDLYKPDVEPHILFWEVKSLMTALVEAGLKPISCQTVGMPIRKAASLFRPTRTIIDKIADPWTWKGKINSVFHRLGVGFHFDFNRRFKMDCYGGERQWVRCLAKSM